MWLHLLGPNQTKDKGVAAVAEDDAVLVLEGNRIAHQLAVEEDRQVSIVGGARGGAEDLEDHGVGAVVGRGRRSRKMRIEESALQRDEVNLQVGLGHQRVVDANVHRVAGADHRPRLGQLVLLPIVQKGGQHLALVGVGVTDGHHHLRRGSKRESVTWFGLVGAEGMVKEVNKQLTTVQFSSQSQRENVFGKLSQREDLLRSGRLCC